MAVTTKKSLLFLAGGVAAAALVAYFAGAFDPLSRPTPETIAAQPDPRKEPGETGQPDASPDVQASASDETSPAADDAGAPEKTEAEVADAPTEPGAAGVASEEPVVVPPRFDVVRLEPDGSIVIAGKAAPHAVVDLLVGSKVIGSETAGPEGDFAIVLDDPLKPGNYQIVLRATAPGNVVAMSVETALVSVPETSDGQVLALVEEPGKPSQMITLPEPKAPPQDVTAEPSEEDPVAGETAHEQQAEEQQADEQQAREGQAGEQQAGEQQTGEGQAADVQVAPVQEAEPAASASTPAEAGPAVRVEAVEIDGRKIFVAGLAEPGRRVRGYANEILLGDAKASPDGRYLIEADRDLPVGDYIIRVDALEADGVKVAARAAVPFEREPGETIAAVAPSEPVAQPRTMPRQEAAEPSVPQAQLQEAPEAKPSGTEAGSPVTDVPTTDAPGSQAVADAPVASDPQVSELQKPESEPVRRQPEGEAPASVGEKPVETGPETDEAEAGAVARPALPVTDEQPSVPESETPRAHEPAGSTTETGNSVASAPADIAEKDASPAGTAPEADEPQADSAAAAPGQERDLADLTSPDGIREVLAPKLQAVDSAVIIRRGDTLWRISRRVYGRGVRYSTIYLANQNQIEDPDRIWPGQVFKVPQKSRDGEAEADYSKLGNRLTTVPLENEKKPEPAPAGAPQ